MIYADRTSPLPAFADFVKKNKPQHWERDFVLANKELYQLTRTELLEKQSGVSAYTERKLEAKGNIHIDHFKKKGIPAFAKLTFRWSNLIVDEQGETCYGAGHKDKRVKTPDDYARLINPADVNPERYFGYLANGEMFPATGLSPEDKAKAEYTIATFNLNHPTLINCRSEKIRTVMSYKSYGFTDNEILTWMQNEGFPSVITYAVRHF